MVDRPVRRRQPTKRGPRVLHPKTRALPYTGSGPGHYGVEGRDVIVDTPQYVQLSGSADGWVPPIIFGARVVPGQLILAYTPDDGKNIYLAYALAEGDVDSITDIKFNDEDVSTISWITSYESHLGGYTQSVSTLLSGAIADHVECWPGLAYVVLKIDGVKADATSMTLTAKCTGRKLYDWRTGTNVLTANPIVQALEIIAKSELWLGATQYPIDTDSWTAAANWCDDIMSDGTVRFDCHLVTNPSNPDAVLDKILSHAHAKLIIADGKYVIVQDRALTPRDLHIGTGDWVADPTIQELPRQSRPNTIMVRYHVDDNHADPVVTVENGDVAAGEKPIVLQAVCDGFKTATKAYRWGGQRLNILQTETITVTGIAGPIAADVSPGEAIYISTLSGLDNQQARVEQVSDLGNGTYKLQLRTGVISDSSGTLADDATASSGSLWLTGTPNAPTSVAATTEYGEVGDGVGAARISVSWTAPTSGVAVAHYEVEADSKLVASTVGTSARFYTHKTGTVAINVYSVSPSGIRSSSAGTSTATISTTLAKVTKVQGTPWSSSPPSDTNVPVYDTTDDKW